MQLKKLKDIINNYKNISISNIDVFNKKDSIPYKENSISNVVKFYKLTCSMGEYIKSVIPYIYNLDESFIIIHINEFHSLKNKYIFEGYLGIETKRVIETLDKRYIHLNSVELNGLLNKVFRHNTVHSYVLCVDEISNTESVEINVVDGDYAIVKVFNPISLCELDNIILEYDEFHKSLLDIKESEIRIIREERKENRNFKEGEIRLENINYKESENHSRLREREYELREKGRESIECELVGEDCSHLNGELKINYIDQRCINKGRNRNKARGRIRDRCENICEYRREMEERIFNEGRILMNMVDESENSIEYLLSSRSKGMFNVGIYLFSDKSDAMYLYSMMFSNLEAESHAISEYNIFDITENKEALKMGINSFSNKSLCNNIKKEKNKFNSLMDSCFIINNFI